MKELLDVSLGIAKILPGRTALVSTIFVLEEWSLWFATLSRPWPRFARGRRAYARIRVTAALTASKTRAE